MCSYLFDGYGDSRTSNVGLFDPCWLCEGMYWVCFNLASQRYTFGGLTAIQKTENYTLNRLLRKSIYFGQYPPCRLCNCEYRHVSGNLQTLFWVAIYSLSSDSRCTDQSEIAAWCDCSRLLLVTFHDLLKLFVLFFLSWWRFWT